jgi:hypothetical protein
MALNEHQIISSQKKKRMAVAFRVARWANDKDWGRFMRRK